MQGLVLANSAPTHVGVNIPLKYGRAWPLLVAGGIDLGEEGGGEPPGKNWSEKELQKRIKTNVFLEKKNCSGKKKVAGKINTSLACSFFILAC